MAGLYDLLTRKKPKSAAEELKEPAAKPEKPSPGGLGGKISTDDVLKIRPTFTEYKTEGGELDWESYVDEYKKTGNIPKP